MYILQTNNSTINILILLHEFNNTSHLSYIFCTKNSTDNIIARNLPWVTSDSYSPHREIRYYDFEVRHPCFVNQ